MSAAYYNENDPFAVQWLQNLIAAGLIAPGDVDDRSILDVRPTDLAGYTQCHFFAGIGGWSYALRLADWPDSRPVWTGSCPCQPFSTAGTGKAADDERHLWPVWFPLIAQCRPAIVFGEQVEAAIGWGWLDAVFADLEAEGYACGASILPACGVGAPHIRQRCWFVAHADGGFAGNGHLQPGRQHGQQPQDGGAGRVADPVRGRAGHGPGAGLREEGAAVGSDGRLSREGGGAGIDRATGCVGNAAGAERAGRADPGTATGAPAASNRAGQQSAGREQPTRTGIAGDMADAARRGRREQRHAPQPGRGGHADGGVVAGELGDASGARLRRDAGTILGPQEEGGRARLVDGRGADQPIVAGNPWHDAAWLPCIDGKARPVEPGTFPLAHGIPARVGRLRAYGNAITPQIAAQFIAAHTGSAA